MWSSSRAIVVSLVVIATLLGGCSSDPEAGSTTSTSSLPVTSAPTTLPPTTTEPAKATGGAPTAREAAAQLVSAWENDDLAAAARIADALGVMGIFAVPEDSMWIRGCTPDDDPLPEGGCIYRAESGLIQINAERRPQGWVVSSAVYDPFDNGNATSGDAPDAPPPTTLPPSTPAAPTTAPSAPVN